MQVTASSKKSRHVTHMCGQKVGFDVVFVLSCCVLLSVVVTKRRKLAFPEKSDEHPNGNGQDLNNMVNNGKNKC